MNSKVRQYDGFTPGASFRENAEITDWGGGYPAFYGFYESEWFPLAQKHDGLAKLRGAIRAFLESDAIEKFNLSLRSSFRDPGTEESFLGKLRISIERMER